MSIKTDIVLAGVGGQGVLSVAAIIAAAARAEGLHVKQGEVHGMSQRGGAVQACLRIADRTIHSDLVPLGTAAMILGMEPVESLRYLAWLAPTGSVVTAVDPVLNIPNYPSMDEVVGKLRSLPSAVLIEADRIARESGSPKVSNVVMIGAASPLLPIATTTIEEQIRQMFARKGEKIVDVNLRAFALGREAGQCVTS